MSVAVLRRAASQMRQYAKAARLYAGDEKWGYSGDRGTLTYPVQTSHKGVPVADAYSEECADHIAAWHPAVALAVAEWLECVADDWEAEGGAYPHLMLNQAQSALDVARAFLGEP